MMKYLAILGATLCLGVIAMPASADFTTVLIPEGDPVFGSISQGASGTMGMPYVGMRTVVPSGFNGAYIKGITGVGVSVPGTVKYELRDDFSGGSVLQTVESWWNLNGSNSFTTTFEIADPTVFPSLDPSDYAGLIVQCALARADHSFAVSREWIFTDGAEPVGTPTGGGSWTAWNNGWYLSPLHYDGSAWSGSPAPVPGAVLLGLLGLGAAGVKLRRRA